MSAANVEAPDFVPAHVQRDLVWDHDLNEFAGSGDDPYVALAALHDDPRDFVWARGVALGGAGWVPVSYKAMEEVLMRPEIFSSDDAYDTEVLLGPGFRQLPLEVDPPRHGPLRRAIQPAFTPNAVRALNARIRGVARDLIGSFADRGGCEFRAEFAALFPSRVFCALMGLPQEDLPKFLEWQHQYARDPDLSQRMAALNTIRDYLQNFLEGRRSSLTEDIASLILSAQVEGRPLTPDEVMGLCITLYLGGLDTVTSSLGWYFRHLAQDQALQDRLRSNPDDIPAAVDEFLRAFGVVTLFRNVACDADFHGATLRKGDKVYLVTPLASRDPKQYAHPHKLDLAPSHRLRHLTLATGPHTCLGVHLAKSEIRIVLEEWLSTFSEIRINPSEEMVARPGGMVWTVEKLPLLMTRSSTL
jgi:cytochrome P450